MRTVTTNVYTYDELHYDAQKNARYYVSRCYNDDFENYRDNFFSEVLKDKLEKMFNATVENYCAYSKYSTVVRDSYEPDYIDDVEKDEYGEYSVDYEFELVFNKSNGDAMTNLFDAVSKKFDVEFNVKNVIAVKATYKDGKTSVLLATKGTMSKEKKMLVQVLCEKYFDTIVRESLNSFFVRYAKEYLADEDKFEWFCCVKGFEFLKNGKIFNKEFV
jgi:hypothetical protein